MTLSAKLTKTLNAEMTEKEMLAQEARLALGGNKLRKRIKAQNRVKKMLAE